MWLKVFYFCLILISSQTSDLGTLKGYNNTFQNGKDCFSGPFFWTTCRIPQTKDLLHFHGPPFPRVRPKRIFLTICSQICVKSLWPLYYPKCLS